MHRLASSQNFVAGTLHDLVRSLNDPKQATPAIAGATGLHDAAEVESQRQAYLQQFTNLADAATAEKLEERESYVSRSEGVGVFQSILATLFRDFPDLQGYGDKDPSWITTKIEEMNHFFVGFGLPGLICTSCNHRNWVQGAGYGKEAAYG